MDFFNISSLVLNNDFAESGFCSFEFNQTNLKFSIDPSNGQDQLAECMERKLCFEDFDEQKICFMPTYKFNPNSRIYDTSRTLRQPSFTVSDAIINES